MTFDELLALYTPLCKELRLPFSSEDIKIWAVDTEVSEEELNTIYSLLKAMNKKKDEAAIRTLKNLSRIPQKSPLTFDNFDTSLLNQDARKTISSLKTLAFMSTKRNVIMVGPTGTGKTHLAMAIGNACCETKSKAYFIKMGELKAKFQEALKNNTDGKLLNGLSKYSCFIIDEVGYCRFDKRETLLFFQLIDRIYAKEYGSIVLTSNKDTSEWQSFFEEDDALECTLDRLCDRAICLSFSGSSHRGNKREHHELNFMKLR